MDGIITAVQTQKSKFGGEFYRVCFKDVKSGESAYTNVYPHFRNYTRWRDIVRYYDTKKEIILKGLRKKKGRLIDADSRFEVSYGFGPAISSTAA